MKTLFERYLVNERWADYPVYADRDNTGHPLKRAYNRMRTGNYTFDAVRVRPNAGYATPDMTYAVQTVHPDAFPDVNITVLFKVPQSNADLKSMGDLARYIYDIKVSAEGNDRINAEKVAEDLQIPLKGI